MQVNGTLSEVSKRKSRFKMEILAKTRRETHMIRNVLSALFALMIALSFAGCGGGDSGSQGLVGTTEHDNWVYLQDNLPSFAGTMAYVEANHSITSGQPWGGVNASFSTSGTLSIDAVAGRKKSSGVADWFRSNASTATCTAGCGSAWPSELNFAFVGTITINGTEYPITIGQGSMWTGTNNWWIGGPGWIWPQSRLNAGEITTPDGKYCVWPEEDSSDEFYVSDSCLSDDGEENQNSDR